MPINDYRQEILDFVLPATFLSEIGDWLQDHLAPDDIFTEAQLRTWALDNGMVYDQEEAPEPPSVKFWYDNQVEEIANSDCSTCRKRYKIIEIFATTVDVSCDCGPSEFDLVPENDMDEAAIHY